MLHMVGPHLEAGEPKGIVTELRAMEAAGLKHAEPLGQLAAGLFSGLCADSTHD